MMSDVEALTWLRNWAAPRLDVSPEDASCEHCIFGLEALAALDRLIAVLSQAAEGSRILDGMIASLEATPSVVPDIELTQAQVEALLEPD